jgi:hypothetical protein
MPHAASSKLSAAAPRRIAALLDLIDEAFNRRSWHGTNLRGSVRRVAAPDAGWRPPGAQHSIADIVVHCAYWKYTVRRRLVGAPRGSFPLPGSDWFKLADPLGEGDWRAYVALLNAQHADLRAALVALAPARLAEKPAKSKVPTEMLLRGGALHDVYHAGQIQYLKGLGKRR